jgi:hypothetical protein
MDHSTASGSTCGNGKTRPAHERQISNGSRIRRNLLVKLGVHPSDPNILSRDPSRGSLLGKVPTSVVPLKYSDDEKDGAEVALGSAPPRNISKPRNVSKPWAINTLFERRELTGTERTCSFSSSSEASTPESMGRQTRKLTFNDNVLVCPIPQHGEYSKRIKERLWTPADDAARDAERNTIEFASEGWDWRRVLDDDDMYQNLMTRELVHPIHVALWQEPRTDGDGSDGSIRSRGMVVHR